MQVRELLTIEALQPITAQTGEVGLDRPMKDVVLLEYDSLQQQRPEGYYQDDFIVSHSLFRQGSAGGAAAHGAAADPSGGRRAGL